MPKIVLDTKESVMALFFELFFDATRKLGLSDKEACEAFKKSVEAMENAPAEERCAWYRSPANNERILQREFNNEMQKND